MEAAARLLGTPTSFKKKNSFLKKRGVDLVRAIRAANENPNAQAACIEAYIRAVPPIVRTRDEAPSETEIKAFYESWEWKRLSYQAKIKQGRRCQCCGSSPAEGAVIHTDHVKPIRRYWSERLNPRNLQILCGDCNMGKGSWDETDFRLKAS